MIALSKSPKIETSNVYDKYKIFSCHTCSVYTYYTFTEEYQVPVGAFSMWMIE